MSKEYDRAAMRRNMAPIAMDTQLIKKLEDEEKPMGSVEEMLRQLTREIEYTGEAVVALGNRISPVLMAEGSQSPPPPCGRLANEESPVRPARSEMACRLEVLVTQMNNTLHHVESLTRRVEL